MNAQEKYAAKQRKRQAQRDQEAAKKQATHTANPMPAGEQSLVQAKEAQDRKDEAREQRESERDNTLLRHSFWQVVFAAGIVFATVVQGAFSVAQWDAMVVQNKSVADQYDAMLAANKEMARQNTIMERQVAQTDESIRLTEEANIASESTAQHAQELAAEQLKLIRESEKRQLRAYISHAESAMLKPGPFINRQGQSATRESWAATVEMSNVGATPATDVTSIAVAIVDRCRDIRNA